MNLPCKVIEDILPIYYDGICSEESTTLIEKHLNGCTHCNRILSALRSDITTAEKNVDDMKPLKSIQKSFKKMKISWLIAISVFVLLIPMAFVFGSSQGEQRPQPVDLSKEDAIAYANSFLTCLVEKDYAKAYSYWNVEEEKKELLTGDLFTEEELVDFETDGLNKFCEGGEKLESWGGITNFQFVEISDAQYNNRYGTEDYLVSYIIKFNGKDEALSVSLTKDGIDSLRSGDGLIRHPLSHLTLWVQWVVDDYTGRYYDFNLGEWIEIEP